MIWVIRRYDTHETVAFGEEYIPIMQYTRQHCPDCYIELMDETQAVLAMQKPLTEVEVKEFLRRYLREIV